MEHEPDQLARIRATKEAVRRDVLARVKELGAEVREQVSIAARAILEGRREWQEARSVMLYAPLPMELDVTPLAARALASGKTVAFPQFDGAGRSYCACIVTDLSRDLVTGQFGILEPKRGGERTGTNRLDFILCPAVAFDLRGCRLGRGKGFYDRMLAGARGKVCGVAFDEQIVESLPAEPHDVFVNCILTPTRWIEL